MKTTIFHVATSVATVLSLFASANACGPGGGYRSPSIPYSSPYPSPYSGGPFGPISQNVVKQNLTTPVAPVTPSAPQARLTVVSATEPPKGNLQIASPLKTDGDAKSTTKETPNTDSKPVETTASATLESSTIADAIKGLVGSWRAVSRKSDGSLSTVELQLDDSGWAKLTVPGTDGKPSTTTRKVEFENSELKLTGADADVMLGKLVEFNSRQMVLERSGGQVTFVRP